MALMLEAMILSPNQFQATWNDSDTRTDYDLQAWQGQAPSGWFLIGDLAESAGSDWIYGSQPRGALIAVRDVSTDGDVALEAVNNFQQLWNNSGGIGGDWGSVWQLQPGSFSQIPLGNAITASKDTPPAGGIYCAFNPAVLLAAQIGPEIWSDTGMRGLDVTPMTLFQVVPSATHPQGIQHGSFVFGFGTTAPGVGVMTLNPAYVTWVPA